MRIISFILFLITMITFSSAQFYCNEDYCESQVLACTIDINCFPTIASALTCGTLACLTSLNTPENDATTTAYLTCLEQCFSIIPNSN